MTSFTFHTSWADALRALPAEARLEVYDAIVAYAATGSVSDLSPFANMAFSFMRAAIDADAATREKRAMAGRKHKGNQYSTPIDSDETEQSEQAPLEQNGTSWNKMEQVGTSWNKLEQIGTSWNKLEQIGTCVPSVPNASPLTLPQEETSPITPKEDNPLIFPLEEETPTMVGAKKADPAELMEKRKQAFLMQLTPFFSRYGQAMCQDFSDYWTEPNRSRTKMRFELERTWDLARRLATWSKRDNSFSRHGPDTHQQRLQGYADVAAEFLGASQS